MGGQAQDGQGPTQPSVERDWSMVPEEPAQESARAARGTESQVARTLCLLRHHRERCVIGAVPARGPPTMAQMAQPTGRANTDDVGAVCPCAERLSPPCGASRAQCVPLSSETIVRGAGCPSGASPDLWEPRVGNCPRPPGRCANPYMVSSRIGRPCLSVTGTGLLSYIRPVDEGRRPSGLDEMRAYRPYRPIGVVVPPSDQPGLRYAGLTCGVIACHIAFAIRRSVTSCC